MFSCQMLWSPFFPTRDPNLRVLTLEWKFTLSRILLPFLLSLLPQPWLFLHPTIRDDSPSCQRGPLAFDFSLHWWLIKLRFSLSIFNVMRLPSNSSLITHYFKLVFLPYFSNTPGTVWLLHSLLFHHFWWEFWQLTHYQFWQYTTSVCQESSVFYLLSIKALAVSLPVDNPASKT